MTKKNKFKIRDLSVHKIWFLSSTIDDQSWREELIRDDRRAEYLLRKLRKMIIMEIIVKLIIVTWAFVWTAMSLITWITRESIWITIFSTLMTIGFWFIVAKSAGSIEVIHVEIKDVKRELRVNGKK